MVGAGESVEATLTAMCYGLSEDAPPPLAPPPQSSGREIMWLPRAHGEEGLPATVVYLSLIR